MAGVLAAGLAVAIVPSSSLAGGSEPGPEIVGRWSRPFDTGTVAVHAVLLHSGRVLIWYWPHAGLPTSDGTGSVAKLIDPQTRTVTDASVPFAYDAFCAGHTVLADGRVFVAGGNRYADPSYDGTRQTATFDLADRSWTQGDSMEFARWYPSTTQLPDGDVLIMSGWETDHAEPVHRIERYHVGTGRITPLPSSADLDMRLYPRTFLLPGGDVLRVGPDELTTRLETTSWTWSNVDSMVHGLRIAGAAVLLPGLDRVLALGGARPDGTSATDTAEILELDRARPAWRSIAPMHHERLYMNAVLLPDRDVLVVGGGRVAPWDGPVRTAELFDTETETWRRMAAQAASRMYHSTALLLPDGRVLSAGQNNGDLQRTAEIYSPPYLFRGPRPRITNVPRVARYGHTLAVETPDGGRISRVALIRAGSVTHSVNFDQRYVDLPFDRVEGGLTARIPGQASVAPPGWYMLFLVDDDGVPSVARWVRVAPESPTS
jgi:galactose oxidase-like protein